MAKKKEKSYAVRVREIVTRTYYLMALSREDAEERYHEGEPMENDCQLDEVESVKEDN